jgi:antitoxin CcdA
MQSRRAKKAVNVSIPVALLDAARTFDINLSATLEAALEEKLRQRRKEEWRAANVVGMDAYNRDVEERGVFSDGLRTF